MTQPVSEVELPADLGTDLYPVWSGYLGAVVPVRADLHRYCCRLTGNVWDGEDLVQDTLIKVFGIRGKTFGEIGNIRAYLIRTATRLWIDRIRRRDAEARAFVGAHDRGNVVTESTTTQGGGETAAAVRDAAGALLAHLPPRERAAILMKDVFDLSLEETASVLKTSVGAVKSALHRGRGRLEDADWEQPAAGPFPPSELVERFVAAMNTGDIAAVNAICSDDLTAELVGGATSEGRESCQIFLGVALSQLATPSVDLHTKPRFEVAEYEGETLVLGFREQNGVEGLNEIMRLEEAEGVVGTIRCYCFTPETLDLVAAKLGVRANERTYPTGHSRLKS